MQNQSKHNITFDTQLKTALNGFIYFYDTSWKNLFHGQDISSLVIISLILVSYMFDHVVRRSYTWDANQASKGSGGPRLVSASARGVPLAL